MYGNDDRPAQWVRMIDTQRERRGHEFLPPDAELVNLPGMYDQEEITESQVIIHLHYFALSADWWVAELWESKDAPGRWDAFGYTRFAPEETPTWATFSLTDLERLSIPMRPTDPVLHLRPMNGARFVVERDLHWSPAPAHECVPGIANHQNGAIDV